MFNLKYPKLFQKRSDSNADAALASMETLDDKLDTPNDGMETVKLDGAVRFFYRVVCNSLIITH